MATRVTSKAKKNLIPKLTRLLFRSNRILFPLHFGNRPQVGTMKWEFSERPKETTMDNDEQSGLDFFNRQLQPQPVNRCFFDCGLTFFQFTFAWLAVGVILVGLAELSTSYASAQVVVGNRDDEIDDEIERSLRDTLTQKEQSVFIPTPREVLRPLLRADRAIKEKDITRAVSLLGEVLSDSTSEDYLVPVTASVEGVSTSLRLRAQAILGALPRKDRKLYRLRYGVQAKQMLENAIQKDDFDGVSQVMQRFFFTDAGFDAAMLLGHYHLDEGRPIAAANCFSRIAGSPEGRAIHDPEASVLLATCWMLGDSPVRAKLALTELKKTTNFNSIEFMGRPVDLFADDEDALGWLQKLIGDSPLREIEMVNQWVMTGGNPQRNARSGTGFPLITPRWTTVTLNHPDIEESVIKRQQDLIYLKSAPIPAVQPLAVGDTIVMRAFDRMIGVDFKTGKRVWVFPPADFTASVGADDFGSTDADLKRRTLPKSSLTERLWLDSIYGQASSDGRRIFVVPQPGFSAQSVRARRGVDQPLLQRTYNELKAVDIERQGAFVWEVGGETGLDEPKLAKSLFLGAPLPLGSELFAVCRQQSEVLLVVLDAQTGKLNWFQRLGTTETSMNLDQDRYRRLAGATPSFADGIVVCSTGTGALVGVDLSTRSLLWGYQYASPGKKEVQPISPERHSNSDPLAGLWRDSAITIADGKVLFTPVDSQELICVDLQNGFPGYQPSTGPSSKSPRGDALFVACVENGLTVLQGENNVRAISLATGNPVWRLELGDYGKPSGRGYANRGSYFFPTTSQHVLQVDLKTGKLTKAVTTDGVLGNLVCHKGDVLSHGVGRLSSFPQDEPNRELIKVASGKGELSPEQLAIKSQLLLQENDLRGAIETIESAYQQSPNRNFEKLLLDLILQAMESDFDYGSELAQRHVTALKKRRKFEYLTAKISGLVLAEKYESSVEELLGLLDPISEIKNLKNEFIEVPAEKYDVLNPDSNQTIIRKTDTQGAPAKRKANVSLGPADKITIRLDRWIASRIGLIYSQVDGERRTELASTINELSSRLVAAATDAKNADSNPQDLFDAISVFPLDLISPQTRYELFTQLIDQGKHFQAIDLLKSLEQSESESDQQLAARAAALLAEHWIEAKLPAKANGIALRIESRYPDIVVSGEAKGADFASSVRERTKPTSPARSDLKFNHVETTSTTLSEAVRFKPSRINLKNTDVAKYGTYQFRFLQQTGEFSIFDAHGREIHKFYARQQQKETIVPYNHYAKGRISIKDNLALVDIAREMFVFDLVKLETDQDPVLWYKGLPDGEQDHSLGAVSEAWGELALPARSRGYERRVYVSPPRSDVICYFDAPHLIAVDARTGDKVWQRPSRFPASILLGDEELIASWNPTQRIANFYRPADGRLVATKRLPPQAGAVWQAYGTHLLVSNVRDAKSKPDQKTESDKDTKSGKRRSVLDRNTRVKTLGLFDLFNEKLIWEKEFPASDGMRNDRSTIACRIGQERIVVLTPEGDLQFLNVQTGNIDFATPVKLDRADRQDIDGIGVVEKKGKYLVHLKRGHCPSRTTIDDLDAGFLYINYSELTWFGTLICVDSKTGEDLWNDHVRFDYLQIAQGTPFNTPIYGFLRRFTNSTSSGTNSDCQVIGIDIENGQRVFNSLIDPMSGYQATYTFTHHPDKQEMALEYGQYRTTFKMSYSDDQPPAPVAHLLKRNTIPESFLKRTRFSLDTELIKAEQQKVLQKALAAQKLLSEKRAREKRLLEAERDSR